MATPARVLSPTAEPATSSGEDERQTGCAPMNSRLEGMPSWPTPVDIADVTRPVADDVTAMNKRLRDIVANRHPRLQSAADQIFGAGGKKLRPVLVFLVARATGQLTGLRCGFAADLRRERLCRPSAMAFSRAPNYSWWNRAALPACIAVLLYIRPSS